MASDFRRVDLGIGLDTPIYSTEDFGGEFEHIGQDFTGATFQACVSDILNTRLFALEVEVVNGSTFRLRSRSAVISQHIGNHRYEVRVLQNNQSTVIQNGVFHIRTGSTCPDL